MRRSDRLFEIVQMLRAARAPLTARALAGRLEVATRTVYRDIAALQAMRVPVEGAAGVGYVMRAGFDLPPLMFGADEIEAIAVGLALLGRTRDTGLQKAAFSVRDKIAAVLPAGPGPGIHAPALQVSAWTAVPASDALPLMRRAIREERKLRLHYRDADCVETRRTVRPLALIYYVDNILLAAWCELRDDFRHFRADRIAICAEHDGRFAGEGAGLRDRWQVLQAPVPAAPA